MPARCPRCQAEVDLATATNAGDRARCPACATTFALEGAVATTDWAGRPVRKVGKYELLEVIGQGAFGTVWRGRDPELGRDVAVKVPRAGGPAGPKELERFLREARAAAQLRHASIVTVHDVGTADGVPYLVCELVRGVTLADLLSARRPSFREAAGLVAAVADAVGHAHAQGVVHRDIKPSNVMIGDDGTPRVMDFGLARRDAVDGTVTQEGQVLGTPAYMSPEQARGEGHGADGRTDVYSLGVVLYEVLTGERPFRGTARMVMHQVLRDEPRPPRRVNDAVPRDLETVCLKAMAKEPGGRYATAWALADDLRRWLRGEPVVARPVGRVGRAWRWARRNPAVAGLTAAVVGVMVAGVVVSTAFALQAKDEARRADERADEADRERDKAREAALEEAAARESAQKQSKRADSLSHALLLEKAVRALVDHRDSALAKDLLARCPAGMEQTWEHRYVLGLHRRLAPLTLKGHTGSVTSVAFSPDGTRIASGGQGVDRKANEVWGEVRVWDMRIGKWALTLKGHRGIIDCVKFSPDGACIVSGGTKYDPKGKSGTGEVRVWDAKTGHELLALKGLAGCVRSVAYSPDGKRIASASGSWDARQRYLAGQLKVWDAQTGEEILTLRGHTDGVSSVAFSPDGQRIASASHDKTVRVWDAATGREKLSLQTNPTFPLSVAFSPDSQHLAAGCQDGALKVWGARSGEEKLSLTDEHGSVTNVAFSPDGTRLISGSMEMTVKVWDARTGRGWLTLKGHTDAVYGVACSPDGRRIASASFDRTVKVWDGLAGQEVLVLQGGPHNVLGVAFSPDGTRIASASGGHNFMTRSDWGEVRVWDAETGQEKLALKGHAGATSSVTYGPEGTRIAAGGFDGTLIVWDAATGQQKLRFKSHKHVVRALAFSPDGQRIASAGHDGLDGAVKVWDALTGVEKLSLKGHTRSVTGVAFSRNGQRIASAGEDGTVRVWDALTGEGKLTLKGHAGFVQDVAFSPDGSRIASGSYDRTIKVWDASTGQEKLSLTGHADIVTGVAFSPDGRRIASASHDKTVRLWDAESGQEKLAFTKHTSVVYRVAFSTDGRRLASGHGDRTVKVWDVPNP